MEFNSGTDAKISKRDIMKNVMTNTLEIALISFGILDHVKSEEKVVIGK